MYYGNYIDGSPKLKRHSTRHVSEVTAIATEFGNSAKIIVPRSWLGRRVITFPHSEFISKHPEERRKDE
jgi:putative transposon-encoded protein